jgi:hypothetical protein
MVQVCISNPTEERIFLKKKQFPDFQVIQQIILKEKVGISSAYRLLSCLGILIN